MQLPFTKEQFLDLFEAYNEALWPAVVLLWVASTIVIVMLLWSRRPLGRLICALLAIHWLWSAAAYHIAFFTRINPAAWIFAGIFFAQGALFLFAGVVQERMSFARWRNGWSFVAWGLISYSLIYPAINAVDHQSAWRIPTFGVPCPTTIFTAGVLMLGVPRSWRLSVIPMTWSVIGGSAAFLLDVPADYVLPVAGAALAIFTLQKPRGAIRSAWQSRA